MIDYQAKHLAGEIKEFFQPKADCMPDWMHSFEVFGSLENGVKATGLSEEYWERFDCSMGDPIEEPSFLD